MEVTYHPLVQRDVLEILRYYHRISPRLTAEFQDELRGLIKQAAVNSLRFHLTDCNFRWINLRRFPYHILYDASPNLVRVMIVRHNKRHPQFGMNRS